MEWSVAENFSMLYAHRMGSRCTIVEHAEIMNAECLIAERISCYRNCLISINLPKHPAFVSAILGVMKTRNVFVCCPERTASDCSAYQSAAVSCIISTNKEESEKLPLIVHGLKIYFHHKGYHCLDAYQKDGLCYLITTSGTLGKKKEVLVPNSCIMPNIYDFSGRFQITASDTILFATAATFDPFIVEIFLAVVNGAKLLIVPDSFRSNPSQLADAIIRYGATFIQMTPSQLKILPHMALMQIFDGSTAVRTILLGGEAFPINFLQRYHINEQFITFYNVYGITEVSCWASCYKIDFKESRVEIGEPLSETKFNVTESGELLIGGSRRCFINGNLSGNWHPTGDIVERLESGKIYWCDRSDDLQKINGIKVSLSELARKAESFDSIQSAICLRRQQSILIFVFTKNNSISVDLSSKLSINGLSVIVIEVDSWPITLNGKVDRKKLLQIFEERCLVFTMKDLNNLLGNFGINLEQDQQMTLRELGLTSLHAAELTIKTEHLLKKSDFPLMQYLLSGTATVTGFLDLLDFASSTSSKKLKRTCEVILRPLENSKETHMEWEFDLGKCIDAMPAVENDCIFLGSHSGQFVSLLLDGSKNWQLQLDARIEASACCRNGIVAVGCYDGYVYFLNAKSGQMIWKFGSDDVIKSIPVLIDSATKCLFGSHDKCLYLLDIENQKLLWKIVCNGSILSSPLPVAGIVLCATLTGEFLAVDLATGKLSWKIQLGAPIFANPGLVKQDRAVVVDVKGMVTQCNLNNGTIIHQYNVDECVFAAPVFFPDSTNSQCLIVTQNSSLFLLQADTLQLLCHLRIENVGSFPRAPQILDDGRVFIQDSSGSLLAFEGFENLLKNDPEIIDFAIASLKVTLILKVPGETFGGVKVLKCDESISWTNSDDVGGAKKTTVPYRALIGSRDNCLRCYYISL